MINYSIFNYFALHGMISLKQIASIFEVFILVGLCFLTLSGNIDHPTLKSIVQYRKHSSIIAIALKFTKECFSFTTITIEHGLKKNQYIR